MTLVEMNWAMGGFFWVEEMPRETREMELEMKTSSHISCPITKTQTNHTRKSSGECGSHVFGKTSQKRAKLCSSHYIGSLNNFVKSLCFLREYAYAAIDFIFNKFKARFVKEAPHHITVYLTGFDLRHWRQLKSRGFTFFSYLFNRLTFKSPL